MTLEFISKKPHDLIQFNTIERQILHIGLSHDEPCKISITTCIKPSPSLLKEVCCPQTCFEFVARRNHQGRQIAALLQPSPGLEFGQRGNWTSTGETNVSGREVTGDKWKANHSSDLLHTWDYTAMNHVQSSYTRAKQHANGVLSFCEGHTSANGPSNGPSSTAIGSGCYASSEDPAVTQSNHFYAPIL